jgi:glycosyltransferase involved in cell wall biosynthesis
MPSLRRRRPQPLRADAPPNLLDVLRDGPAPLKGRAPGAKSPLNIGFVVPGFRRGSGGHAAIAELVRGLEARGHTTELIILDSEGRHREDDVSELFRRFFGQVKARIATDGPEQSDLLVATGWQTVPRVLSTPGMRGRAYLVQDHEPEFYGTSAERLWAEWTYSQGLHCVCSSPWLEQRIADYGATTSHFRYGVDHSVYSSLPTHRRDDLILAYGRAVTARRAVPLAMLALEEFHRRRPQIEIALFGESRQVDTPFPYRDLGVLDGPGLAHAYASSTVGLVLSLTNPSLVPAEMLACGLPVVDARSESMLACFGDDGPVTLAELNPLAICESIEKLVDDLVARADASRAGIELAATFTWERAAADLEAGLRSAFKR